MKYLFATLLMFCAGTCHAEDNYAPLQAADLGNWYDVTKPGIGFDILPYPNYGAFVTFYGGTINGIPAWYNAQLVWSGPTSQGRLYKTGVLFNGEQTQVEVVGDILFAVDGSPTCNHLAVDISFTPTSGLGASQHYDLIPLIQPNFAQCAASCPLVSFGPYPLECTAGE